ncbi:MAG: hypothetical protein NTU88_09960 [Armatimonadetes bacterium]|nr:hypothetical protein [Armatimonadota bacterium]
MIDTTPEALAAQTEVYRKMTPVQRLEIAFDMSLAARELSLARLRMEHPDWTEKQLQREILRYAFLPGELPEALRCP